MTVAENQERLRQNFGAFPDRQERLSAIVEWSRKSPRLPPELRTPAQRVPGCLSPVWIAPEFTNGNLRFRSDAESVVVRALVALLCAVWEQVTPAEAAAEKPTPTILDELDLVRDLSPTRRLGLQAVAERLRDVAHSYAAR